MENGSISLTVNPRRRSCGLTPECVQVSQVVVSKESGGRKEAYQLSGWQHRNRKPLHTHPLQAGKTTKCQGWFWETAAGAPVAVGMETAVELGCKQRTDAFEFT